MPTISIRQLTPDDRYWRIDWFGEFAYPPGSRRSQPSVHVAISPLLCNPEDSITMLSAAATCLNNQRQAWLPVGILNLVRIGDIWKDGQCVLTPDYQIENFGKLEINKGTRNFIKAGLPLNGEYLLPLHEHPWHSLQTQSYCLTVTLPHDKRIIIPCIELIRFYFGSSSKMLHILFTGQISPHDFYRDIQLDVLSGRLHLKLADGISGMSAADIGRISLNQDAWHTARLIFDTCMAAAVRREPIYPYTGFPFVGETDLVAAGKWVPCGTTPASTFVVYSLRSCSHPFPFKSLSYESVENKKEDVKKNSQGSQNQDSQDNSPLRNGTAAKSQTLTDADPGKSRSGKEYWTKGNPRFPDLTNKPVWRERYDTVDAPAILFKTTPLDEEVSVGERVGNGKIRALDVVSEVSTEISANDASVPKFVRKGIKTAIDRSILLATDIKTTLITLPGYSHPVISLPHLVDEDGEINPISFYSDLNFSGDQRLRRGCFVEIMVEQMLRYRVFIVEAENMIGKIKVIDVQEFDLKQGMNELIESSP